jgi:hypothetical protein
MWSMVLEVLGSKLSQTKVLLFWASSTVLTLGVLARLLLTLPPSLDLFLEITMALLAAILLGAWTFKEE